MTAAADLTCRASNVNDSDAEIQGREGINRKAGRREGENFWVRQACGLQRDVGKARTRGASAHPPQENFPPSRLPVVSFSLSSDKKSGTPNGGSRLGSK